MVRRTHRATVGWCLAVGGTTRGIPEAVCGPYRERACRVGISQRRNQRSRAPGRRGARLLPGGHLRGARGPGPRGGLGRGNLHRSYQRGAHRGKPARAARGANESLLGARLLGGDGSALVSRREGPGSVQRGERGLDRHLRGARLLHAPFSARRLLSGRRAGGAELLRDDPAPRDPRTLRGFRPNQRGADPPQRRRRQRAHQKLRLLRHPARPDHARAHHGLRCPAPGFPAGHHRGRVLLGRRHRLEHAAAIRPRRGARARPHGVPGGPDSPRAERCPGP